MKLGVYLTFLHVPATMFHYFPPSGLLMHLCIYLTRKLSCKELALILNVFTKESNEFPLRYFH